MVISAGLDYDGRMLGDDGSGLRTSFRSGLERARTGCYANSGAVLRSHAIDCGGRNRQERYCCCSFLIDCAPEINSIHFLSTFSVTPAPSPLSPSNSLKDLVRTSTNATFNLLPRLPHLFSSLFSVGFRGKTFGIRVLKCLERT